MGQTAKTPAAQGSRGGVASGGSKGKKSKSKKKYKGYVKPIHGYLVDNQGVLHELLSAMAKALEGSVEPEYYTEHDGKNVPVWATDKGGDRFTAGSTYKVNDCVFRAIQKYLEALGLGTLTEGDRKFFETHPRVNGSGVNKANVLCVAHGLIVPWGLGITRVWVPKMSALGDQHLEFASALGINPMALSTYETSNDDLVEFLDLDPYSEEAMELKDSFRFEFVDYPSGPAVVMLSNWNGGGSTKGGANVSGKWSSNATGMGHADFIGPRDTLYGDWQIAFQIGRLPTYADNKINRYESVKSAFTPEELQANAHANKTFSRWNSVVGGKSLNSWDFSKRPTVVTRTTPATPSKGNGSAGGALVTQGTAKTEDLAPCPQCKGMVAEIEGLRYCLACNWFLDTEAVEAGVKAEYLCPFCYNEMTQAQTCTNESCEYDAAEWTDSDYFACARHGIPLMFKPGTVDGKIGYIYTCEECLFAANEDLKEFLAEGKSHPSNLTVQIKALPEPAEKDDKDKEVDDGKTV